MSIKHTSENLVHFISNQGYHMNAPIIEFATNTPTIQGFMQIGTYNLEITVNTANLYGTWNINGQPILSGDISVGRNLTQVLTSSPPYRNIHHLYPRSCSFSVNINLIAGVPQIIDWAGKVQIQDTFPLDPSIGTCLDYVAPKPGTTTDWQFSNGGYYDFFIKGTLGATLGANQEISYQIQKSEDSGGSWSNIQTDKQQVGGLGSLVVDFIGGNKIFIYAPQGAPIGNQRIRFIMTCTENKAIAAEVFWILNGRDI